MDQAIKYLNERMENLWNQENLYVLEETMAVAMREVERMIDMEKDENVLQEFSEYIYEAEEERYMLDNYMLVGEEQAGTQHSGDNFDFDIEYFQSVQETSH